MNLFGSDNAGSYPYGQAIGDVGSAPASSSPVKDFYFLLADSLNNQADSFYTPPFNAQQATSTAVLCDPNQGLIAGTLCWLFIPQEGSFNQFGAIDLIKNKPPIGYYYAIKLVFDENLSQTTSSLIATSTTNALSTILNPIQTAFSFFLWFLFAMWLFHRIRLLDI